MYILATHIYIVKEKVSLAADGQLSLHLRGGGLLAHLG